MDNSQLIKNFYTAFQNKDWLGMQKCYHDKIQFSDPVFPDLKEKRANAMWHMLVAASTDLAIEFSQVEASASHGSCHWEAIYTFSKTGRKVHNKIDATFEFENGLIIRHSDTFDLWHWSKMALGTPGLLLGWSSFMKKKIRFMAEQNLRNFIGKNPVYNH